LAKDIRITTQTRNLFTIDYQDRDPRIAHDVVATTLNLFMEAATVTDRQQMENARGFLNQQIASYEVQLRQAERRKAEFQTRYIDILPSDALGGITRLESARGRLAQVQGELTDARRRRELTQQQFERCATDPRLRGQWWRRGQLPLGPMRNASWLSCACGSPIMHPDVVAARNIVAAIRAGGGAARSAGPAVPVLREPARSNPLYERMQERLVDVDSQLASLERQEREGLAEVQRLDAIARSEPEVQAQFLNLDRDYTVLRRNYEELLSRRESLQLAGAPATVRTAFVSKWWIRRRCRRSRCRSSVRCWRPHTADGPRRWGCARVLLVQLDRTFYTVQDLRRIGPPVLGSVSGRVRRSTVLGRIGFAGGLAMLLMAFGGVVSGAPGMLWRMLA
jgi:hypothetical protein